MGSFGLYLYEGGRWSELGLDAQPTAQEPWLLVRIHDSDIGTVTFGPTGPGSGLAFLGVTPRIYFDDESASPSTEPNREARGLAAWWAVVHVEADEAARAAKEGELRAFLAADIPPSDDEDEDDEDLDDAEVFVEIKAARFIRALGLPVPAGLSG